MSIPRGFYETAEECDLYSPAFLRGVLISNQQFQGVDKLFSFPRWMLYAGPFSDKQTAQAWDAYLLHWAAINQRIWISDGTPCIVKKKVSSAGSGLPWPPDSSFQWSWVYELEQPRRVVKYWDGYQYRYKWEYGGSV